MIETTPIVTLDEVKDFLDVRENVTKLDSRFTMLSKLASSQVEQAVGRVFARREIVEYFTARDTIRTDYDFGGAGSYDVDPGFPTSGLKATAMPQTLYLKGVGIDPDADLWIWYDPSPTDTDAYGDGDLLEPVRDYGVDFENDTVLIYVGTRYRINAFKVRYTAGYAIDGDTISGAAPADLKMAVLIQTAYLNAKLRADNIGMGSERTVSSKDRVHEAPFLAVSGLTPEALSIVRKYKRVQTGRG